MAFPTTQSPAIWMVVADGTAAVAYRRHREAHHMPLRAKAGATHDHYRTENEWVLEPVQTLHAASTGDFERDQREGRVFDRFGPGRHRTIERATPEEQVAQRLMKRLAEWLNEAHKRQEFARLVLSAPPRLLGELRAALDKQTAAAVVAELPKNLSHEPAPALARLFDDALRGS